MSNEELMRILNEIIVKNLGHATAYGYAKSKGYTGTEEEFAILMADYAHVAQDAEQSAQHAAESALAAHNSEINAGNSEGAAENAKLAAQRAQTAAETAQGKAEDAQQAAETAETNADSHAEDAEAWAVGTRDGSPVGQTDPTYHNNAKYYAEEAERQEGRAAQAASDASDAKDAAVSAKNDAVDAKDIAVSAKNDAVDAKDAAVSAKNDAELAETGAVNAKNDAIDAKDAAVIAKTDAQSAKNDAVSAKNDAVTAKTDAQTAKDQAVTAKNDAQTAKSGADSAKADAISAKNDAVTAKNGAVDAKDAAQAAQAAAEEAATHVADMALMQAIAPKYDSTAAYKVGNLLTYLGKQYYCIADAPAGTLPTNTTYFEGKSVADIIEMIKTGKITVGKATLADNFDSKMVLTDNSGYLFRTAGGSLEIGEQNRVKKIIGASVPIINPLKNGDFASGTTNWTGTAGQSSISVSDGILTSTILTTGGWMAGPRQVDVDVANGDIVLVKASLKYNSLTNNRLLMGFYKSSLYKGVVSFEVSNSSYTNCVAIFTCTSDEPEFLIVPDLNYGAFVVNDTFNVKDVTIVNLTKTFGITVAQRLRTLEQANKGTGIAKAKEILVKDYYPYNVTAFTHTKTSGKVNNGFNQFNGIWETGYINNTTGAIVYGQGYSTTDFIPYIPDNLYYCRAVIKNTDSCDIAWYDDNKNFIRKLSSSMQIFNKVFPNANLSFPSNARYIRLTITDANVKRDGFCINLHWDGERDGEYEAYQEWNYPVEDVELKGILSLDAQDNWVYYGDEYTPNGIVTRVYRAVVLDDQSWTVHSQGFYTCELNHECKYVNSSVVPNWASSKYVLSTGQYVYGHPTEYGLLGANGWYLYVTDTQTPTGTIYVELTTPTTEEADPYTELQNISNWGTEKWIDTRDVPLPVFSEAEYLPDLKAKTEVAPESPDDDGEYVMHRENGINTYESLATYLSDNGYAPVQDSSSSVTLNGLTAVIKKCYTVGNMVYLSIKASNEGSEIVANTAIVSLASAIRPMEGGCRFYAAIGGNATQAFIDNAGSLSLPSAIAASAVVSIFICYPTA